MPPSLFGLLHSSLEQFRSWHNSRPLTRVQHYGFLHRFLPVKYTPHGYLDNPAHSHVFNRRGVIRSYPPLGFGWWRTAFTGSYGGGVRDHVNYISILQINVTADGKIFASENDFARNKVELYSAYHTKNMTSYDWSSGDLSISLKYFLPRENTLSCLIDLENRGGQDKNKELFDRPEKSAEGDVVFDGKNEDAYTVRVEFE